MTTFADLHSGPVPLLLPNAWDVPSALAFAGAGFPAVGTTSFGICASAGCPDGDRASWAANLRLVGDLAGLGVHVSVDIEDGYDDAPREVAERVAALVATAPNFAGVNIEDSTGTRLIAPEAHAAKVRAIKRRCPRVFVNARVDTYWLGQDATTSATADRAIRYVEAGADGIFVPGVTDPAAIAELARRLPVPLNVLVHPRLSRAELGAIGVRRISTGSLAYRAALSAAVTTAIAARDGRIAPPAIGYGDLQARLTEYATKSTTTAHP